METSEQRIEKPKINKSREAKFSDEQSKLELDIVKVEGLIRERKYKTKSYTLAGAIITVAALVLIYSVLLINPDILGFGKDKIFPVLLYFGSAFGAMVVFIYFMLQSRVHALNSELDLLNTKKRISYQLPPSPNSAAQVSTTYFDSLVRINVENLAEYYSLVKIHTDNSFRVSIIAGMIGFTLIMIGLAVGFINNSNNQAIVYISTGSGIAVEFISGIFFYLYNRTIIRLKDYHDSLLAIQNVLLSFKIVGEIKDEKEKVKMMGQMLGFLIGKQSFTLPITEGSATEKK